MNRNPVLYSHNFLGAAKESQDIPFFSKVLLTFATTLLKLQNVLLWLTQKLLYKKKPLPPKRILLFRTGSLGDSICAIPAIRAVAQQYPDAAIDILTNAGKKSLVGLHHMLTPGEYHEIIDYYEYPKKVLFQWLRKKKYDMVIQLPQVDAPFTSLLRDMIIFRAIAASGLGWHKSQSTWFRKIQASYLEFPNEIQRLLWLLKQHGFTPVQEEAILYPAAKDVQTAKALLQQEGWQPGIPLIAVVVGAKRPQNRWPIGYFKQVVEHITNRYQVVLAGSQEDNELVRPLMDIRQVINACGRLTPMESAALLSLCTLTISNDTGPMHLSYGVGTPTIALFSSRDLPGKWYPPLDRNVFFRTPDVPCQACFSETCNNNICMQAISPEQVIAEAENLLEQEIKAR